MVGKLSDDYCKLILKLSIHKNKEKYTLLDNVL